MKGKLQAGNRILALIERPFALQHQLERFVRIPARGSENFAVGIRIHLRNRHVQVLHAQAAEQTCQFLPKALAEEYVEITLRGRIEYQETFSEFVEVVERAVMKCRVHVPMRIVGEEGHERYGWHDADEIRGDDDHQHVRDVMPFLFVRVELSVDAFGVRESLNETKIELEDHNERENADEKAIDEQGHRDAIGQRLAQLAQARHPEYGQLDDGVIEEWVTVGSVTEVVMVLIDRVTFLSE